MFGASSKPLHLPERRHADRRAGAATDAFRDAFDVPSTRVPRAVRSASVQRQSRARLRTRWDPEAPAALAVALYMLAAVVLAVMAVAAWEDIGLPALF